MKNEEIIELTVIKLAECGVTQHELRNLPSVSTGRAFINAMRQADETLTQMTRQHEKNAAVQREALRKELVDGLL